MRITSWRVKQKFDDCYEQKVWESRDSNNFWSRLLEKKEVLLRSYIVYK